MTLNHPMGQEPDSQTCVETHVSFKIQSKFLDFSLSCKGGMQLQEDGHPAGAAPLCLCSG